jgi:hypothetical protein
MKVIPFPTEHFGYDGRGPSLDRFLHDRERIAPGTFTDRARPPGNITGAEYDAGFAWVIFDGLQVIQVVPEEVHSYWFFGEAFLRVPLSGVFEVLESEWMESFKPRHLSGHRHFILVFYDQLVEVICQRLVFGRGRFDIAQHPELSYY